MEYEEIKQLKQSEKSSVQLVREKGSGQVFVRKVLQGYQPVYAVLQDCMHPGLAKLYEVHLAEDFTTVIEEYIEGQPLDGSKLSKKQFWGIVRELCSVLEYLHEKGIIHRDIKPSNIILATDGHIRLIDFDAARMPKDNLQQDTRLLGTRGYAPPEQYGFDQTDVRTDIYALGVTLKQLFGDKIHRPRYKRIIRKCMRLDPDKRYQSVRQVKKAFFHIKRSILCGFMALIMIIFLCNYMQSSIVVKRWIAVRQHEDEILFYYEPVYGYIGRMVDDIMDESGVPYDYNEGGGSNYCSYLGISYLFDYRHEVYCVTLDPARSTVNGVLLNKNRDKLIEALGKPSSEGWGSRGEEDVEDVYFMQYDNYDNEFSFTFFMTSPDERAHTISVWQR